MAKQTDDGLEFQPGEDWWQEDRVTTQLRAVERVEPFKIDAKLDAEFNAWLDQREQERKRHD